MKNNKKIIIGLIIILLVGAYFAWNQKGANYSIDTGVQTIEVSEEKWKKIEDSDSYAKNFEARNKTSKEEFSQIITVFLNTMTSDRMIGEKITNNEYLQMFIVHPDTVTVQIRNNKTQYWVLSRQTFSTSDLGLENINPEESKENFNLYRVAFQNEIDSTRFVLDSEF